MRRRRNLVVAQSGGPTCVINNSLRGVEISVPESLRKWMKGETKLGNPALKKAVESNGDADLKRTLERDEG